jgi:hypothetical protein
MSECKSSCDSSVADKYGYRPSFDGYTPPMCPTAPLDLRGAQVFNPFADPTFTGPVSPRSPATLRRPVAPCATSPSHCPSAEEKGQMLPPIMLRQYADSRANNRKIKRSHDPKVQAKAAKHRESADRANRRAAEAKAYNDAAKESSWSMYSLSKAFDSVMISAPSHVEETKFVPSVSP